MMIFPFYRREIPQIIVPPQVEYFEVDKDGNLVKSVLDAKDNRYVALKRIINEEKAGWRYDYNSYAAITYYVWKDVKVICRGNGAVIIFKEEEGSGSVQIVKDDLQQSCK